MYLPCALHGAEMEDFEMDWILVLLSMIFFHIVDDFYLQGLLINMKQKSWWEKNAPNEMYKNDYIMALFMHSFSWSFMIMLPVIVYAIYSGIGLNGNYIIPYFINMSIHAVVDDFKANKKKINLIQDQIIHLIQILVTWVVFILILQ